jgi:hypothetical protein
VLLAAAALPLHAANTVTLYQNAYSYPVGIAGGDSGGEFTAVTSPQAFLGNYAPQATVNPGSGLGFETFCVQVNVQFNPGQTYNYSLSQNMQLNSANQPVTLGAAYLYNLFATANPLLGYNYTDPATRLADAGLLQSAIWDLEGGQSWSGDPFNPATNPYYQLALSHLGGLSAADSPSGGAYGVDFLALTDNNGGPAQNQLVYVGGSVPDGGSTAMFLAAGFGGLTLVNRRRSRKS